MYHKSLKVTKEEEAVREDDEGILVSYNNNDYFLFSLEKVVGGERWTAKMQKQNYCTSYKLLFEPFKSHTLKMLLK